MRAEILVSDIVKRESTGDARFVNSLGGKSPAQAREPPDQPVTAPSEADPTSRAYLASAPVS
jgi:hypothetical protein